MKLGRNDPCPCGSGKKYKQCCLKAQEVQQPENFAWYQLNRAVKEFSDKLMEFSKEHFGSEGLLEAWNEFMPCEEGELTLDTPHMRIFLAWFYFDWHPNPVDTGVREEALDGRTLAQTFFDEKGQQFEPLLKRYITQCCAAPLSFYDIVSVRPGDGFVLRDIMTGEELYVTEHSASQNADVGGILFCKVIKLDRVAVVEAGASILFPPLEKRAILDLREEIYAQENPPSQAFLKNYDREMIDTYYQIYERLVNPVKPELQNTDNEPIVFQRLIYKINAPKAAFEALVHLDIVYSKDELLENAEFNEAGELHQIQFHWQKKDNKRNKSWDNTILGHIKIKAQQLSVEVNSENRALKFRQLMAELLPDAHYSTSVIESPQAMFAQAEKEGETDELNNRPEVQTHIAQMMQEHFRQWPQQALPILNGKTPLQAVKTKNGREMVEALLLTFEQSNGNSSLSIDPSVFVELREQLGLK